MDAPGAHVPLDEDDAPAMTTVQPAKKKQSAAAAQQAAQQAATMATLERECELVLAPRNDRSRKPRAIPPTKLCVFDFDGTLFRSPVPSHSIWESSSTGKLHSEPSQGGLGWFQAPDSLCPPIVPETPDDEWWIANVVDQARTHLSDPTTVTILLTGRDESMRDRVAHLLQSHRLAFDHVAFKLSIPGTAHFKQRAIQTLMKHYPSIEQVEMWDDREDHQKKFRDFLFELTSTKKIIPEQARDTAAHEQRAVAEALIARHNKKLEIVRVSQYMSLSLDLASRVALTSAFGPFPDGHAVRADHVTLALGAHDAAPIDRLRAQLKRPRLNEGDQHQVRVVAIARSSRVWAAQVEALKADELAFANSIPHVTLCFDPATARPEASNALKRWDRLPKAKQLLLSGVIEERGLLKLRSTVEKPYVPPPVRPGGLGMGELAQKHHPSANGPLTGLLVKHIREWLTAHPEAADSIEDPASGAFAALETSLRGVDLRVLAASLPQGAADRKKKKGGQGGPEALAMDVHTNVTAATGVSSLSPSAAAAAAVVGSDDDDGGGGDATLAPAGGGKRRGKGKKSPAAKPVVAVGGSFAALMEMEDE